jgi:hypothetical protein
MVAVCGIALSSSAACGASIRIGDQPSGGPSCPARTDSSPDRLNGALLLTAQSVPSAGLVPCLRPLPAGWSYQRLDARKGRARISLDFEHQGTHAMTVSLTRDCDVREATEKVTDQPGTHRYERVDEVSSGYRGERHYVYGGGCITYRFDLYGSRGEDQIAAISPAIGFVDRSVVRRYVHDYSDGHFELDPTAAGGAG